MKLTATDYTTRHSYSYQIFDRGVYRCRVNPLTPAFQHWAGERHFYHPSPSPSVHSRSYLCVYVDGDHCYICLANSGYHRYNAQVQGNIAILKADPRFSPYLLDHDK